VADVDLRIEVVDDGNGIPTGSHRGFGLSAMEERAAEVGGSCTVAPGAAGGTRVVALLPLGVP
jgi:signal transduction histidine kinase